MLGELLDEYRSPTAATTTASIPVSGGKDSYFQTHVVTEVLRPQAAARHLSRQQLPAGGRAQPLPDARGLRLRPHHRPAERRRADEDEPAVLPDDGRHELARPLRDLHRTRSRSPSGTEVPLIVWGEHGFMDLGGMFSYSDFVEFTAKSRLEHALRGYDWYDMTDDGRTGIDRAQDLLWAQYPSRRRDRRGRRPRHLPLELRHRGRPTPDTQLMSRPVRLGAVARAVRAHLPPHLEPRRHARERHPRLPEVRQVRLRAGDRPRLQGHPRRPDDARGGRRDGAPLRPRQADATSSAGSTTSA